MRETVSNIDAKQAYAAIIRQKIKYGNYHKVLFHVHTPASYDYHLLKEWGVKTYQQKTTEDVINVFSNFSGIHCNFSKNNGDKSIPKVFVSEKELWSYLLLGEGLCKNNIELVVVADHHTIDGILKLQTAISELNKKKTLKIYPEVIGGVEISCADRLHVVGIFDASNIVIQQKISQWLQDNLIDEESGVFETSLEVMHQLKEFEAIPYIAHINTSDIFKKEKYLSGAYRKKIFGSEFLRIIGISSANMKISTMQQIENVSESIKKDKINFVIDNDAHDIQGLERNSFWIKGEKRNFFMLQEALENYDISVSLSVSNHSHTYIKGMYVAPKMGNNTSFLTSRDKQQAFVINFSNALNCFIGGRGTGKSTVLELLEYTLNQRCSNEKMLNFLCMHGNTYVLCVCEEKEYLIEMIMPYKDTEENNILFRFGQNQDQRYHYSYMFYDKKIAEYAFKNYLNVYEVEHFCLRRVHSKKAVLRKLFDIRYSVNELVSTASGDTINQFIYNKLFENKTLSNLDSQVKFYNIGGLQDFLSRITTILEYRKQKIHLEITPFNESQKNLLQIVYHQNIESYTEPPVSEWLFGNDKPAKYYKNFNITSQHVVDYLLRIYDQMSMVQFCILLFSKTITAEKYPILPFVEPTAEQSFHIITRNNEDKIIKIILGDICKLSNLQSIKNYFRNYFQNIEKFSLEFNVNSKVSNVQQKPSYKDIQLLSLGQKVVAMLDFILGYSEYSGDYRPLIIDQPEDNLDSQYIYNNLVTQLRHVKEERQILIATHNATIVTNAMADQVCVMQSDGEHGWIEANGYPGENNIKKYIINCLEGGIDSFRHKQQVYKRIM